MAPKTRKSPDASLAKTAFATDQLTSAAIPIYFAQDDADLRAAKLYNSRHQAWLMATGFKPGSRKVALIPGDNGELAAVIMGCPKPAERRPADPMGRTELQLGVLAATLSPGIYRLASPVSDPCLAAVAWALGAYRFRRYKSQDADAIPQLVMPDGADPATIFGIVDGVAIGRDLINTPANDMGPAEIEDAMRALAGAHDAKISSIVGDALLPANFPLIHAVGRASPRAPRLIDMNWQAPGIKTTAPLVTLVGKGIAFDTGGLDLKPSAGMLIMKKDMGGAATAIAAAHMIMQASLPVRLRLIVAAAENSVSGNAFRPLDVIKSRAGHTVEIGNTDAEGRLVLADALALADEDTPDLLITFATLTGAARVAMGPDLPPFFTDDDVLAAELVASGLATADPVWRLPFWQAYESGLDSSVADLSNVSESPFAGAITAALFLRKFVRNAKKFAHFDIYGWRAAQKPLGPKGGEVNAARAVFHLIQNMTA